MTIPRFPEAESLCNMWHVLPLLLSAQSLNDGFYRLRLRMGCLAALQRSQILRFHAGTWIKGSDIGNQDENCFFRTGYWNTKLRKEDLEVLSKVQRTVEMIGNCLV